MAIPSQSASAQQTEPMPIRREESRLVLGWLLAAVFVSGCVAIRVAPAESVIAPWWPPAGLGVLVILWSRREHIVGYLVALYVVQVVANLTGGHALGTSALLSGADVLETLIVVSLLRAYGCTGTLDSLPDLVRLVVSATIGTGIGALLITAITNSLMAVSAPVLLAHTFLSHLTAVILLAPVGMAIRQRHVVTRSWFERVAHVAVLIAATLLVFAPDQGYALAWVPAMVLVPAAMRLGPRFIALELLIVSAGVQVASRLGWGPFSTTGTEWWGPGLIGKVYLMALVATTLPLALAQRQHAMSLQDLEQRSEELLDQTRFTQTILDATADLVLVVDDDTLVLTSNRTASDLTGFSAAELKGNGWRRLTPPEWANDGLERWRRIIATERDREPIELEVMVKDGSRRRLMVRSQPLLDRGEAKHVVIGLDVTAERNAAGWLMHILTAESTTAIIGCDIGGRILVFSRGAELLTCRRADEVVNTPATDLLRAPAGTSLPPSLDEVVDAAVRDGAPSTRDWLVDRGAEEPILVSLTTSEISDSYGSRIGFLLVAQDVTESREAERRLAEIDQAKNEFVSTASHEIRTPMTSVIGYTEMLLDGVVGELSGAQHEIINAIARNGQRLLSLADELLTVSRLDAGIQTSTRSDFDLHECLDQALSHYGGAAAARKVHLRADFPVGPVSCHGDVSDLQRVFLNLISNAVKFTPPGGVVTCRLRELDDRLQVSIEDTGMGIPEADLGAVFHRFFRSENAVRGAVQGTGLGLSIVAAIVEEHHGTITVDSVEGAGTTFTVTLPAP